MEKQIKKKAIAGDLLYSMVALVLFNGVLQLIVYPLINREMGESAFGDVLYLIGIVSILAPSFGPAVNNTRLVLQNRLETKNGDYNFTLLLFSGLSVAAVVVILLFSRQLSLMTAIILSAITILTIFRYYSDVEYRLKINYKKYLVFYVILSIGYLLGLGAYYLTKNWVWVFLIAEAAPILFVILRGNIYKKAFQCSENRKAVLRDSFILALSYLLSYSMMNMDRLVLMNMVSSDAVSQYYVLSLIGKTVALLVGPISSIMISYLSKFSDMMGKKLYLKIIILMAVLCAAFLVVAIVATPIFIRIFYPNLAGQPFFLIVIINISQIVFFAGSLLLIVVLTLSSVKWQLIIQGTYAVLLTILSVLFTHYWAIAGFALAVLISNIYRFMCTLLIGLKKSKEKNFAIKEAPN
ncbi:lipopolysaccharide biosynthesis protein [Christensenella timonensis]|uniref:lipopolysaccharide biosynthesis protein n=1 Tax=Christensenella timonensis TaxID=1816678 RepID=UPI00083654C4|nr:hypothetical protein [Christensenella timonensis]